MALFEVTPDNLSKISQKSFEQVGLRERADLQRLLKKQIDVILPETLVIAEEFGEWDESRRRIDLLGIDKMANLVVIELKRTDDGGHMELQAIRYAAMVSMMTFDRAVELFSGFLTQNGDNSDARELILDFLDWEEPDEDSFAQDVKIALISANFSKELTTAVIWLNKRDLDIRCIRLIPYADNGRVLIDVQQVIPLPEAVEYQIQIKEKEQKERQERVGRHPLPKFWKSLLLLGEGRTILHQKMSPSERPYINASIGIGGVSFNYVVSKRGSRVELYISKAERSSNKLIFDALIANKNEIENAFGQPISWQRLDDNTASRISYSMNSGGYRDDETIWRVIQLEMIENMVRFENALMPHLLNLSS